MTASHSSTGVSDERTAGGKGGKGCGEVLCRNLWRQSCLHMRCRREKQRRTGKRGTGGRYGDGYILACHSSTCLHPQASPSLPAPGLPHATCTVQPPVAPAHDAWAPLLMYLHRLGFIHRRHLPSQSQESARATCTSRPPQHPLPTICYTSMALGRALSTTAASHPLLHPAMHPLVRCVEWGGVREGV